MIITPRAIIIPQFFPFSVPPPPIHYSRNADLTFRASARVEFPPGPPVKDAPSNARGGTPGMAAGIVPVGVPPPVAFHDTGTGSTLLPYRTGGVRARKQAAPPHEDSPTSAVSQEIHFSKPRDP
ncbi:hypothetical protein GCM10027168_14450 [Streptomyces capparidis]